MPTKHPPSDTDGTEDGLSQHVKKKIERGRLSTTTTNDRPKRNATKPEKQNFATLLAEYASATISKIAASLPPFDDGINLKKRRAWNQSWRDTRPWGLHLRKA
jgi:hypothetical protein